MPTAAEWITILVALVSAAVLWGKHTAQLAGVREQIREIRHEQERRTKETHESEQRQGERIGRLEGWRKAVDAVDKDRRLRGRTGANPVTTPPEET